MTTYGNFQRTIYTSSGAVNETYTMYGRPGSTIRDEANRLANGGEYPALDKYLDVQGAFAKWASMPAGTGILASLNNKVSITNPAQFRALNAAVNAIIESIDAGGGDVDSSLNELQPQNLLEAVTALRLIAS